MKKWIIGCSLFCLIATQVAAQIPTFTRGDNVAGLGLGVGGTLYADLFSGYKQTPYFLLNYEHCIIDNLWDERSSIGVGGQMGYASAKWENSGGAYGWKRSDFNIGVRGSLHYTFVDKLDTYAGILFSYNIVSYKYWGTSGIETRSNPDNIMIPTVFAGARYYLADSFAVFAELGYGVSIFSFGVSFKF